MYIGYMGIQGRPVFPFATRESTVEPLHKYTLGTKNCMLFSQVCLYPGAYNILNFDWDRGSHVYMLIYRMLIERFYCMGHQPCGDMQILGDKIHQETGLESELIWFKVLRNSNSPVLERCPKLTGVSNILKL
jgi:hypothetical protein